MKSYELDGVLYIEPESAQEVTEEMLRIAEETFDGYFESDERIDWEEFIDRMVAYGYLADDARLEFSVYDSPAIRKIQKHVRRYRAEG